MGRFLLLALLLIAMPLYASTGKVVIIIDDLGYRATDQAAFSLPKEVAFSILPHTPLAHDFSALALQQQRDVMLHIPMQASPDKKLGPGALTVGMYPYDIENTVEAALRSVPNAIGVNNHMGSVLTEDRLAMQALMNAIKKAHLFFVDSRTTPHSVAQRIAASKSVPNARRHVFLDNILDETAMRTQLSHLVQLAKHQGVAIGIAHPHPETVAFLQKALPELDQQGIQLMPVSEYFNVPHSEPDVPQRPAVSMTAIAPK